MYYPFCISLSVTAHTAIAAAVDLSYSYPATIHCGLWCSCLDGCPCGQNRESERDDERPRKKELITEEGQTMLLALNDDEHAMVSSAHIDAPPPCTRGTTTTIPNI